MTKELCDIKELSNYLKVSIPEIRKLVREKRIPNLRIGKMIKFDLVSINNWLENLEEEQARKSVFY